MRRYCRIFNALAVVALATTLGCSSKPQSTTQGGTTGGTGGTTNPTTYTANLLAVDINGAPIATASLALNGQTFSANSSGRIQAPDLSLTQTQLGLVTSPGYMSFPVLLSPGALQGKVRTVILKHPQLVTTFASNNAATLDLHAHFIALSPNAFVSSNGLPYTGTVNVSASSLDPTTEVFQTFTGTKAFSLRSDFSSSTIPSGGFTMVQTGGGVSNMPPEGYVDLNATDSQGTPLTLAPNTPAVVHIALTPFTMRQVGDVVPLMSFDPNHAMWVQEGNCTVQLIPAARNMPNRLECVGVVHHFSAAGVPASTLTNGVPCINYQVEFSGLTVSDVTLSVQSSLDGNIFVPAEYQALTRDSMECYIGGPKTVRLVARAKVNGVYKIFTSKAQRAYNSALSTDDLAQFQAGQFDHACFKCPVQTVTFSSTDASLAPADNDGDTYTVPGSAGNPSDCNDNNPLVHPGATETVCDTVDKNCDGVVPPGVATMAGAGAAAEWNSVYCKLSCAVLTAEVPGNAYDENCDGIVSDADGDGFYNVADPAYAAAAVSDPNILPDCDDQNPDVHPGLREVAGNLVDEDCDGYVVDADNDGYIAESQGSVSVANVYGLAPLSDANMRYRDCDDWDPTINPNETNLSRESVFAAYYDPASKARLATMCAFINPDGSLNSLGRTQLVDMNCDGLYSDLDGDGYTIAGDTSLGAGLDVDCDDLDPRLNTQTPCTLPASATILDAGSCIPTLEGTRACTAGYTWSAPMDNCVDINECVLGTATCDANQICVNIPGSFACPPLVSPLVAGDMNLSVLAYQAIHVSFQPASGVDGTLTYSIYDIQGTFTDPNITTIQSEGTLFTTANNSNDVDITGLNGNVSYQVAIVVQDANYDMALYGPQSITTTAPPQKTTFVVQTSNANVGGVAGADALCNANNPNNVTTSKAFLVDGNNRVACTTINCGGGASEHLDWVLQPNTQYLTATGAVVTTTDPNGLLTFPLTNAFGPSGSGWYSGVSPDWVMDYSNCNGWTDDGSVDTTLKGAIGNFSDLTPGGLDASLVYCSASGVYLVCVEQ